MCVFHCANAERKRRNLPFQKGILPLLSSVKGRVLEDLLIQSPVPWGFPGWNLKLSLFMQRARRDWREKRPFQISRRLPWGSSDFYRGGLSSSEMSRFPHLCTGILRIYIEALSSDTYTVQMISVTLSLSRLYPWSSH